MPNTFHQDSSRAYKIFLGNDSFAIFYKKVKDLSNNRNNNDINHKYDIHKLYECSVKGEMASIFLDKDGTHANGPCTRSTLPNFFFGTPRMLYPMGVHRLFQGCRVEVPSVVGFTLIFPTIVTLWKKRSEMKIEQE